MTLSLNDTQHNNALQYCWASLCWVSRLMYCNAECHYAECRYAECYAVAAYLPLNITLIKLAHDYVLLTSNHLKGKSYLTFNVWQIWRPQYYLKFGKFLTRISKQKRINLLFNTPVITLTYNSCLANIKKIVKLLANTVSQLLSKVQQIPCQNQQAEYNLPNV